MEVEEKPVIISALERRANAYINRVRQNKLDKYENVDWEKIKHADLSDIDFDAKFIGPKMLTDFQKLHFIAEISDATKAEHKALLDKKIDNDDMARKVREFMGLK